MKRIQAQYTFSDEAVARLRENFRSEMVAGLQGKESSMSMIPSFVTKRPDGISFYSVGLTRPGSEKGNFIALDVGGTNFRVVEVELDGSGKVATKEHKHQIPKDIMKGTSDELFDFLAAKIAQSRTDPRAQRLDPQEGTPLGFTFSFPTGQTGIRSGTLLRWTKGFNVPSAVGQDPCIQLEKALERVGLHLNIAALVNDTVGTLISGCLTDPNTTVGCILGTGSNCCYLEKSHRITKREFHSEDMIINMECGAFSKGLLELQSDEDKILDPMTPNAGSQLNEKMISGMYLGELTRLCLLECHRMGEVFATAVLDPKGAIHQYLGVDTSVISAMVDKPDAFHSTLASLGVTGATEEDKKTVLEVIDLVVKRSAQLVALQLVTILDHIEQPSSTVAIDGSLFLRFPHYPDILKGYIEKLHGQCTVIASRDGSGIGAALIAATAVK